MLKSETVTVHVPATTANCGPGFDAIGIACTLYNELELTLLEEAELTIVISGEGEKILAKDEKNMVWKVIKKLLIRTDSNYHGAIIKMHNKIPLSRGLGSSAAAIVGGIAAANYCLGKPLTKKDILDMATQEEGHPDNVAPAVYGGMTSSIRTENGVQTIAFLPKLPLKLIVAVPSFPLPTKKARKILPQSVLMKHALFNVAHVAGLVAGMCTGDANMLHYAFEDKLHQPYRAKLVPGMYDAFEAAKAAGALGSALSGAGPALIAFCIEKERVIGRAMVEALAHNKVQAECLILEIDNNGAHRIDNRI